MTRHTFELLSMGVVMSALACTAWIAADVIRRPQPMGIMNLVWPLNGLYGGPIALWAYIVLGRQPCKKPDPKGPRPAHDKPTWRGVVVSTAHCAAGCTLGDLVGDNLATQIGFSLFGSPVYGRFLLASLFAYMFGIGFQYFAIAPMKKLGPGAALLAAIKADSLSLAAFQAGMLAWMMISAGLFSTPLDPASWSYWFMMQIAMMAGFVASYPANVWLIRHGVKHAM